MTRLLTSTFCALLMLAASVPAYAQGGRGFLDPGSMDEPTRVLSTNPIGLAARYFNGEYEARVTGNVTAGIGASSLSKSAGLGPYANGDVFIRHYPGGRAFHGVSLDLKTGLTTVGDDGLAAGVGFDVNASHWMNEHVLLSAGFGMKRVFDGADTFVLPTIRIINVGIGF